MLAMLRAINGGDGFDLACALEAGEGGGALDCLAQSVDAFDSVRALDRFAAHPVASGGQTAEGVVGQAAKPVCTHRVKGS